MKIKNLLLYSLVLVILGLAVALRVAWLKPEIKLPRDQKITFIATIKTEPKIADRSQVIEVADSRLYVDLFPRYRVGDRLRIEGEVDENGNIFRAKIDRLSPKLQNGKESPVSAIDNLIVSLRSRISENIKQLLPSREATLVVGTVLGVDDIERGFRDQLIKTGTIHVVVVSGQNLAIVAGLFLSLAKFIGRRFSMFLAVGSVFAYAILTGFEPPVVRASLMVLFSTISVYYGRERIVIWSLLLSVLVILFFSPRALFEVSFQLTFMATLGIVTLGSAMQRWFTRRFKRPFLIFDSIFQNAAVATSAYIFTAPIIFFYFGRISAIGPFVNMLVAELVAPIMILGFLTAGASLIFMPIAQIFAYLVYVPAFIFASLVSLFSV